MADDDDIIMRLAGAIADLGRHRDNVTDAIQEIARLRLRLWDASEQSTQQRLELEAAHADRLADALHGVLTYGAVGNGDAYAALADHQRRRSTT